MTIAPRPPLGAETPPRPRCSVVVCTLNGGRRLATVLDALRRQTVAAELQLVVVDDGSSDDSAALAEAHGAEVVRHPANRGLAAARNTGVAASRAPVVAFLDDDCEPEPEWAGRLLAAFADAGPGVVGVGGPAVVAGRGRYLVGYLERNNPLEPLELDLATSTAPGYRFLRYLRRGATPAPGGVRAVYSLVGANMGFRLDALVAVGGFDERFRFGAEELDACLRLRDRFGPGALFFEPSAVVRHHFDTRPAALLRRHRAYGVGVARLRRKRPELPPTFYPFPLLVAGMLGRSRHGRSWLLGAALLPQLLFVRGLRAAAAARSAWPLLDCYVRLAEEASTDLGVAAGTWRYRSWEPTDA
ncbi:MAG TPA: glycosyltransferase [Acidimicrobiales bacterium]|nr:glycosyltransferase [Acidimicrobiales bacterium]